MEIEELFCKRYPEYSVNGKPLHPYFDVFEEGYEQAEKENAELKKENAELKEVNIELQKLVQQREQRGLEVQEDLLKEKEQLKSEATEIIKSLIALHYNPVVTKDDLKKQDKILEQARQFLRG